MSEQARPWWASDGPVEGGIDPDEDPVERFRAARRGDAAPDGGDAPDRATGGVPDAEPWLDAVAATMTRLAEASAADASASDDGAAPGPGQQAPGEDGDAEGGHGADDGSRAAGHADGGERAGQRASGPQAHTPEVCGICPICVGLRTLAESRPELVGHIAEAARHVALAARSLRERPEDASRPPRGDEPLEHIDLE